MHEICEEMISSSYKSLFPTIAHDETTMNQIPNEFITLVGMKKICMILSWLACHSLVGASVLSRKTVPFSFGWRHRAGLHQWPEDPYEPPINTTITNYIDPGISPKEASEDYEDSDWIQVRLPHDGIISNPFGNAPSIKACPGGCSGRSYIPRHVLWYRKTFQLPFVSENWQEQLLDGTSRIYLRFDGSFRNTTVYLNGRRVFQHECGYTPFRVELTPQNLGLAEVENGDGAMERSTIQSNKRVHTIAVFVDPNNGDGGGPSRGSGWWYEGGGLYRRTWLELVPRIGRISHEGVFCKSNILQISQTNTSRYLRLSNSPSLQDEDATSTTQASLEIRTTFEIEDLKESYCYGFTIKETRDENDRISVLRTFLQSLDLVEYSHAESLFVGGGNDSSMSQAKTITVTENLLLTNPVLWMSSNPHLYDITAHLYKGCETSNENDEHLYAGTTLDESTIHHGIRSIRFDPNTGFYWNDNPFKIRGFCDHDTFAVVGMAIPDRINLFRAQASRSIGGNARRASHNPPDPSVLEIYDRLGMVVIDENRLFDNRTVYMKNMADLVKRDRNHPSVIIWSFCNEGGCEDYHEAGGPAFQSITNELDGSRPTLANMFTFHDLLSDTIDVQGFSHRQRDTLDECHLELPNKPIVQSECCSCNTMRDVDEGCETMSDNPHTTCDQKAFNARCLERLVNASDGTEYSSGTFVWTLLDYYGEPPSRPLTVSSTYGQFDLCGFAKASAFWFRSQWLLEPPALPKQTEVTSTSIGNGRPFETKDLVEVHIVESWESPDHWNQTRGNTTRTIHVYSNAREVELFVQRREDKKPTSLGKQKLVPMVDGDEGTYGEWQDIPWEPGSLIAIARSLEGAELARTRRHTNPLTPSVSMRLTLDCPSPRTGTGSALFLDGSDAALIRVTLVDSETNQTLVFANHTVAFKVVQGPGRILGTANGDPKSKRSHTDSFHPAHHGLVRAVVGVTSVAGLSEEERELLSSMESEIEKCDKRNDNGSYCYSKNDDRDIVIEATSEGLRPVRLMIPTSTDVKHSVLSVAARGAGRPVDLIMSSDFS